MREINKIIIHCADTKPKMDIGVETIRQWHVGERGWSDIGYHDVIRRSGEIEHGRPHEIPGAHAFKNNSHSIGVCLVGGMKQNGKGSEFNFTQAQMLALFGYIAAMKAKYTKAKVIGHNQVSTKECPTFNVAAMFG